MKCFFPVENSHFGRPKTNFRRFQKWKAKKKKEKKSPHLVLERFPASISNFPPFLINFHPFSIFSLPIFSRYVIKNFPLRSLGGHSAPLPPPPPLRHWYYTSIALCSAYTMLTQLHCVSIAALHPPAQKLQNVLYMIIHGFYLWKPILSCIYNVYTYYTSVVYTMYVHITHLLYSYYAFYESKLIISETYCVQCIGLMPYFNLLTEWYFIFLRLIRPVISLCHWKLVHGGVCLLLLFDRITLPVNCCYVHEGILCT